MKKLLIILTVLITLFATSCTTGKSIDKPEIDRGEEATTDIESTPSFITE